MRAPLPLPVCRVPTVPRSDPSTRRRAQCLGLAATLLGIGLGRFAYPPLIPAMIAAGWLSPAGAAQVGAANLAGYLVGAALGLVFGQRLGRRGLLLALVLAALSLLACAMPLGKAWFLGWRFLAGLTGAWLMIRGVSEALLSVPIVDRPLVSGVAFTGIGVGTLLTAGAATLLPWVGPAGAWLLIGLVGAAAALLGGQAWRGLGRAVGEAAAVPAPTSPGPAGGPLAPGLLVIAYGLVAVAIVPHAVFWVDFLVRERAVAEASGALQWWLVGLGSLLGPLLSVRVLRAIGSSASLTLAYLLTGAGLALGVAAGGTLGWSLSSLLIGALVPACVSLTSVALAQRVGATGHARWWAAATLGFAGGQALSSAAMAAYYAQAQTYAPLFAFGAAVAAAAAGLALFAGWSERIGSGGSTRGSS